MESITKQISSLGENLLLRDPIIPEKRLVARSSMMDEMRFLDPCLILKESDGTFSANEVYYFSFNIIKVTNALLKHLDDEQKAAYQNNDYTIQIVLSKSSSFETTILEDVKDEEQLIKEIRVSKSDDLISKKIFIECIFSPLASNYNLIYFRLKRSSIDYAYKLEEKELEYINNQLGWPKLDNPQNNTFSGRFPQIINVNDADKGLGEIVIYRLPNLLTDENAKHCITKIGIQARPGTAFSINGEQLYINRTGFYELAYEGLDIYHIAMAVSQYSNDSNSPFILDYTYTI